MAELMERAFEALAGCRRQADAAALYASMLTKPGSASVDWPRFNAAIESRWSASALKHVKELAWSYVREDSAP